MKKAALAALLLAIFAGVFTLNRSHQMQLDAEALVVADAKRASEEADRRKASEASEAELIAASDIQLRVVAEQCAEMIQKDISSMKPYDWSFTGISPSDYETLKLLAFRNLPMSTYGIETNMDLPVEMNVVDARSFIGNGWAPNTMRFVIFRTDDSLSGLTKSLRLYTCQLDGLTAQSFDQSDNIVIPD